jgi:purine-binding chemotaxis protein CheW
MPLRPHITFRLGSDCFALPVNQVREVLDMEAYTRLPMASDYLLGMVNLRGMAIPLVDLRLKFGMPAPPPTLHSRILVMELEHDGRPCLVGGLADSVREVIELDDATFTAAPRLGLRWKAEVVEAVTLVEGSFVIVLRLAGVFSTEDLRALEPGEYQPSISPGVA